MTKAECLVILAEKFYQVLSVNPQGDPEAGVQWYLVGVFDRTEDETGLLRKNIPIYVENEGLATEVAYWGPAEPKPDPPTEIPFQAKIENFIKEKVDDGTIIYGRVLDINLTIRKARVEAILADRTTKLALIEEDAAGDLALTVL